MNMTRRGFVKQAGVAAGTIAAFPSIIPSTVLGQGAPSKVLTVAVVGVGGMGLSHLTQLLDRDTVRVVAVADVDAFHQKRAAQMGPMPAARLSGSVRVRPQTPHTPSSRP